MAIEHEWVIYESALFAEDVSRFLSDFELDALKYQLARNPFAGAGVRNASPLMSIEFAGAIVIYAVNPTHRVIALVRIGAAIGESIEVDEHEKSRLKETLGWFIKGGFVGLGNKQRTG